jgi:hypothetical protein
MRITLALAELITITLLSGTTMMDQIDAALATARTKTEEEAIQK